MATPKYVTMTLDDMAIKDRYFLLTACVVPRPIAFVTSLDRRTGVLNAAPFSYFNAISSDPPLIMLGLAAKPGDDGLVLKDTTRNITETNEFVVNICTYDMAEVVQKAGEALPPEESEVEALGLETTPSQVVKPPRLAKSPIQFECTLYEAVQFGRIRSQLILGEVQRVHVRDDLWVDGRVDIFHLDPLARMGAGHFAGVRDIVKAAK